MSQSRLRTRRRDKLHNKWSQTSWGAATDAWVDAAGTPATGFPTAGMHAVAGRLAVAPRSDRRSRPASAASQHRCYIHDRTQLAEAIRQAKLEAWQLIQQTVPEHSIPVTPPQQRRASPDENSDATIASSSPRRLALRAASPLDRNSSMEAKFTSVRQSWTKMRDQPSTGSIEQMKSVANSRAPTEAKFRRRNHLQGGQDSNRSCQQRVARCLVMSKPHQRPRTASASSKPSPEARRVAARVKALARAATANSGPDGECSTAYARPQTAGPHQALVTGARPRTAGTRQPAKYAGARPMTAPTKRRSCDTHQSPPELLKTFREADHPGMGWKAWLDWLQQQENQTKAKLDTMEVQGARMPQDVRGNDGSNLAHICATPKGHVALHSDATTVPLVPLAGQRNTKQNSTTSQVFGLDGPDGTDTPDGAERWDSPHADPSLFCLGPNGNITASVDVDRVQLEHSSKLISPTQSLDEPISTNLASGTDLEQQLRNEIAALRLQLQEKSVS